MKFHYKFFLFLLLSVLLVACGEDATPTNDDESNSGEVLSPTAEISSFTPTPREPSESTPTPKPDLPIVTIKNARVNIRSGPGTNYDIVQTLDHNETAPATGFSAGQTWVQIKLPNGTIGWVSTDLVDIENSDEISIVTDISPAPVSTTSSDNNGGSSGGNIENPPPVATEVSQPPPSSDNNGGSSGENIENPPPVATEVSQPPPSSDNNGGSSDGNSGGNNGSSFQCVGGCATAPDPSCAIKGNVNSSGEKIYHVRGGAFYNRTDIKPEEGDRWFCTIAEAEAAGFRESLR